MASPKPLGLCAAEMGMGRCKNTGRGGRQAAGRRERAGRGAGAALSGGVGEVPLQSQPSAGERQTNRKRQGRSRREGKRAHGQQWAAGTGSTERGALGWMNGGLQSRNRKGPREALRNTEAAGGSGRSGLCPAGAAARRPACRDLSESMKGVVAGVPPRSGARAAPQKLRKFECFGSAGKRPLESAVTAAVTPGCRERSRARSPLPRGACGAGERGRTLPSLSWGEKAEEGSRDISAAGRAQCLPHRRHSGGPRGGTQPDSAAQRGEQQPLPELWRRLAAASSPGRSSGLAALHPAGIPAVPSASQFQTGENCSRFLRGSEQSE